MAFADHKIRVIVEGGGARCAFLHLLSRAAVHRGGISIGQRSRVAGGAIIPAARRARTGGILALSSYHGGLALRKLSGPDEPSLKDRGFYHWPVWRRLRKMALQRDHYLCQLHLGPDCTGVATEVHHIKPVEEFPELALDLDNLASACWNCHEKTKQRKNGRELLPVRIIKA